MKPNLKKFEAYDWRTHKFGPVFLNPAHISSALPTFDILFDMATGKKTRDILLYEVTLLDGKCISISRDSLHKAMGWMKDGK